MGRTRKGRAIAAFKVDPALVRCVFLSAVFLAGAFAGRACASTADSDGLRSYLTDYCAALEMGDAFSLGASAALYFGGCAVVFLLGFASLGTVLIPLVCALYGFLTMYTVTCFAAAFGRWGVGLALAALGVRLIFTLPCFFAMADAAWPLASQLAVLSLGRGKLAGPVQYGKRYMFLSVLCVVILCVGILCERFLTPVCFRWALEGAV